MVPTASRRGLLAGMGAGVATVLVGCSASQTDPPQSDDGTLVTDHTAAMTRSTSERPPVVAPRENIGDGGNADKTPPTPEPLSHAIITSDRDASELAFTADATNVTAVRRLLAETAYASESVVGYQTPIGECYRLKVNYVARDPDGDPDVDFCWAIRDSHTACDRSARDHVAAFVRLPFPGDEYDAFSVGSGGSCGPIPERYRNGSESA